MYSTGELGAWGVAGYRAGLSRGSCDDYVHTDQANFYNPARRHSSLEYLTPKNSKPYTHLNPRPRCHNGGTPNGVKACSSGRRDSKRAVCTFASTGPSDTSRQFRAVVDRSTNAISALTLEIRSQRKSAGRRIHWPVTIDFVTESVTYLHRRASRGRSKGMATLFRNRSRCQSRASRLVVSQSVSRGFRRKSRRQLRQRAGRIIQRLVPKSIFHDGPWKCVEDVEWATLTYVDWVNNRRLHGRSECLCAGGVRGALLPST